MEIVTYVAALRRKCQEVKDFKKLDELAETMFDALRNYDGPAGKAVAIAANQLGYRRRMFVMSMPPKPPVCIVNPVITKQRGHQLGPELCLSIPSKVVYVKRPQYITIKAVNQYGRFIKHKLSGFPARVAAHEIDHLDGKLITDYEERR